MQKTEGDKDKKTMRAWRNNIRKAKMNINLKQN